MKRQPPADWQILFITALAMIGGAVSWGTIGFILGTWVARNL